MKKRIAATLLSLSVVGTLIGCGQNTDIGKDKATEIALDDAGLAESDVSRLLVSKDRDDGVTLYEVEFTNNDTEYDYEIQASSGEIINSGIEKNSTSSTQNDTGQSQTEQQNTASSSQSSAQTDVQITQEEAIKMALERVPGATEQDIKIKLDFDDNSYKYEGDIIYNQTEYEFEIDANTGVFLEWSEEKR